MKVYRGRFDLEPLSVNTLLVKFLPPLTIRWTWYNYIRLDFTRRAADWQSRDDNRVRKGIERTEREMQITLLTIHIRDIIGEIISSSLKHPPPPFFFLAANVAIDLKTWDSRHEGWSIQKRSTNFNVFRLDRRILTRAREAYKQGKWNFSASLTTTVINTIIKVTLQVMINNNNSVSGRLKPARPRGRLS